VITSAGWFPAAQSIQSSRSDQFLHFAPFTWKNKFTDFWLAAEKQPQRPAYGQAEGLHDRVASACD